jgi:hypothetical protein
MLSAAAMLATLAVRFLAERESLGFSADGFDGNESFQQMLMGIRFTLRFSRCTMRNGGLRCYIVMFISL